MSENTHSQQKPPATHLHSPWHRQKRIRRLAAALMAHGSPRLAMFGFVTLATLAGFLASVLLHSIGLVEMSQRYVLAVGCAYLAFLGSLWLFVAAYRARARRIAAREGGSSSDVPLGDLLGGPNVVIGRGDSSALPTPPTQIAEAPMKSSNSTSSKGAGGGSIDFGDGDGLVLIVVGLILVAIATAFFASIVVVTQAPLLLAEVIVDGVLLVGLSRRFKNCEVEHWSIGAIKRTWKGALCVAIVFGIVGLALQTLVPGASTMSEALLEALSWRAQG